MRRLKIKMFLNYVVIVAMTAGCGARVKTVTDLPTNVTQSQAQQWDTAIANVHKIATVTSALRLSVISLNHNGIFPDGANYSATLVTIGKIDELQLSATALLRQQPQNFSADTKTQIGALMQQIAAQIVNLNAEGVTGIKDKNSLDSINGLITSLSGAASLVLSLAS